MNREELDTKLLLVADCAVQARQWLAAGPAFIEQALQRIRKAERRLAEAHLAVALVVLDKKLDQVPVKIDETGAHLDAEVVPNDRGGWGIRLFGDDLILGNYPTSEDALRIAASQFQRVRVAPVGPALAPCRPKHPSTSASPLPLTSSSLTSSPAHA